MESFINPEKLNGIELKSSAQIDFAISEQLNKIVDMNQFRGSVKNNVKTAAESVKAQCGRAIAKAVSRWLPTAAARVQPRVWSSGICGGQSGAGAGFLRVLQFPLPFFPPNSPSSQSPGAGTIGQ
jgi:hypothetical protein